MNILIDIGHPAHVHYFKNFISTLISKGHNIFISARDKEVTLRLLDALNISYISRGAGSKGFFGKFLYIFKADKKIYLFARKNKIDLFLSFASPYAAHASALMRKPHITFDDTEAATFGHMMYKPFTDVFVNPKSFLKDFGKNQIRFDGFIELCHLHPNYFKPDPEIYKELGITNDQKYTVLRFVSWEANHDFGKKGFSTEDKIRLVKLIEQYNKVFISSEGMLPADLERYRLPTLPYRIHHVLASANLYIGEGATMASECAMIGTPAIYMNEINPGTIQEQQRLGLLERIVNPSELTVRVSTLLKNPNLKQEHRAKWNKMLSEKIDVTAFMVWFVENYPESFRIMRENPDYQYRFR